MLCELLDQSSYRSAAQAVCVQTTKAAEFSQKGRTGMPYDPQTAQAGLAWCVMQGMAAARRVGCLGGVKIEDLQVQAANPIPSVTDRNPDVECEFFHTRQVRSTSPPPPTSLNACPSPFAPAPPQTLSHKHIHLQAR